MSDEKAVTGYIIVESVYPKAGFPALFNTVGLQSSQILREVYSCGFKKNTKEYKFNGEKHPYQEGGFISTLHTVLGRLMPSLLQYAYTDEFALEPAYMGYKMAQSLPILRVFDEDWGKKEAVYSLPFAPWGSDPIPNVIIYSNPRASFVMLTDDVPKAVAYYDVESKQLKFPNPVEKERIIRLIADHKQTDEFKAICQKGTI